MGNGGDVLRGGFGDRVGNGSNGGLEREPWLRNGGGTQNS